MKAWKLSSHEVSLQKSLIMGILNVTPDSFSDGGKFVDVNTAFLQAFKMIEEGVDILDLGAESTRPGAQPVPPEIQIERLLPILEKIKNLSTLISIDTTNANVAEVCLKAGAHIINDVSGLRDSGGKLAEITARHQAGLILMHRRGNAETMQKLADYEDLIREVAEELRQSLNLALERGVFQEAVILDPGLGFSKNAEQSLALLKEVKQFQELGCPILIGPSRKSFVGKATGREVQEREFGTAGCLAYAWMQGVRFFRVHDVRAARDVLNMLEAIDSSNRLNVKV